MKKNLRRLLKNEFFLLTLFLIKQWLTYNHLNDYYNVNNKHKYILPNDTEFLQKHHRYYESSQLAYRDMQSWLQQNRPNQQFSKLLFNEKNVTLCVGILSKQRFTGIGLNAPFETTVAMLVRTRLKYQQDVRIDVLNVEETGQPRTDLKDLIGLINVVELSRNVTFKIPELKTPKMKESADYIYAMTYYSSSNLQCKYVLLLEDDSLPSPDWYDRIMKAINPIASSDDWFCLKLFTSFRSFDWLIHIPTVIMSIIIALLMAFVFTRLFYFVLYLKHRFIFQINRPQIPVSKYVVLIFILNSLLMLYLYRANHISPIGYGLHSFSIGFNTVANVYPSNKLHLIASFLESGLEDFRSGREEVFKPKDIALNTFRSRTGLREFIFEPAIFQHIGLQSSMGRPVNWEGISRVQYRPFQSYSFEKEYSKLPIRFDSIYWTS